MSKYAVRTIAYTLQSFRISKLAIKWSTLNGLSRLAFYNSAFFAKHVIFVFLTQGETKGKRVDLPTLFRLNPKISGLLGQTQNGSQPAKPKQSRKTILVPQTAASSSAEPQKPSKESQRNIVPKKLVLKKQIYNLIRAPLILCSKPLSPVIEPSSDEYSPIRPLPSAPRSTVAAASVAAANASLPVPSKRHATVAAATAAAAPAAAAPAVSQPLAAAPRARQAAAATLTAKSEVVLKTEEIERNREERRALRVSQRDE